MEDTDKMSDHDLLISMHTTLGRAVGDIQALDRKIDEFNSNYAKKTDMDKELDALKNDVKWLQRIAYGGLGVLGAIQFYFNAIK